MQFTGTFGTVFSHMRVTLLCTVFLRWYWRLDTLVIMFSFTNGNLMVHVCLLYVQVGMLRKVMYRTKVYHPTHSYR